MGSGPGGLAPWWRGGGHSGHGLHACGTAQHAPAHHCTALHTIAWIYTPGPALHTVAQPCTPLHTPAHHCTASHAGAGLHAAGVPLHTTALVRAQLCPRGPALPLWVQICTLLRACTPGVRPCTERPSFARRDVSLCSVTQRRAPWHSFARLHPPPNCCTPPPGSVCPTVVAWWQRRCKGRAMGVRREE